MSWSSQRKITFISILALIIVASFLVIFFVFFYKRETCSDGIQNQKEEGIDCGGPCSNLCVKHNNPVILWTRWSKVSNTETYNLLTYGQNPNTGYGAYDVPYTYEIYDKKNLLIYSGSGVAYIPSLNNFVILNDGIFIGDKVPVRVDFKINYSKIVWQPIGERELGIVAINKNLIDEDSKPKLYVTLENQTINPLKDIESYAILYDENNNAVAFSKTKVDVINKNSREDIVFTWPSKFSVPIVKIEVISEVLEK